jgi:hypothetical protein
MPLKIFPSLLTLSIFEQPNKLCMIPLWSEGCCAMNEVKIGEDSVDGMVGNVNICAN